MPPQSRIRGPPPPHLSTLPLRHITAASTTTTTTTTITNSSSPSTSAAAANTTRQTKNAAPAPTSTPAIVSPENATAISPDFSGDNITSPSEPASIEDFSLDSAHDLPCLSPGSSDEAPGGEGEDGHVPNLPPRQLHHQHSRSYTYLAPSAFAPPFYNRPPTPLPPSPSLTSLLRPNFSTHNSRPTTPDPSSDEGAHHLCGRDAAGTHTPNSAVASTFTNTFRSAKPIPRASPKVPTYEYYGFTLYLTSSLAFIVYILWAFLPSPFLHQLGIYYYPNRWWALAIPAWTVMLLVYIYVALASYNVGYLTLPLRSLECLVDEAANIAVVDAHGKIIRTDKSNGRHKGADIAKQRGRKGKKASARSKDGGRQSRHSSVGKDSSGSELDWRTLWNEGTDAVMDIPIGGVCEILYGDYDDDDTLYE